MIEPAVFWHVFPDCMQSCDTTIIRVRVYYACIGVILICAPGPSSG